PRSRCRSNLEEFPQPPDHPLSHHPELSEDAGRVAGPASSLLAQPVKDETAGGRIHWTGDRVNQSLQMKWGSADTGTAKNGARKSPDVIGPRAAAGEHDAGGGRGVRERALHLAL